MHFQFATAKHICCKHNRLGLNQSFLQIPACRKHTLEAFGQRNTVRAAQPGGSLGATASRPIQSVSSEELARLMATPDSWSRIIVFSSLYPQLSSTYPVWWLLITVWTLILLISHQPSDIGTVLSPFCRSSKRLHAWLWSHCKESYSEPILQVHL